MVKVIATLFVKEELLMDTFKSTNPDVVTNFDEAFKAEMGWVKESGIILDAYQVSK